MKRFLYHSILALVGLAFAGLGGMAVTSHLMKENRLERAAFHAREVAVLKQFENAPPTAQAHPGIAPAAAHGIDLASVITRVMAQYDQPYLNLGSWNLGFETATTGCVTLLLFAFAAFLGIEHREGKAAGLAAAEANS